MKKRTIFRSITAILLVILMAAGLVGCTSGSSGNSDNSVNPGTSVNPSNPGNNVNADTPKANTKPITVVWYPNESANTHDEVRAEVGRLIEQATGRKVEHKTTTDYTIAIEAIASGSADLAMAMGAVGYIEAKNKNPEVNVLFVNADKNGAIDEAKYFSWICVPTDKADEYKSGGTYSIDNIKGKKFSFVSNSSTSGFKVPTASIIEHFAGDNLTQDDLLPDGEFFREVLFGGSHQGSAVNLVAGNSDAAAFCDIELDPYIVLKSGEENTIGAVYTIKPGADAPFNQYEGKEFTVIACTPVFNGPNVYNPKNLSPDEINAILELFTSAEVANDEKIFYNPDDLNAFGLYKMTSSKGYIPVNDSWYDAYRK